MISRCWRQWYHRLWDIDAASKWFPHYPHQSSSCLLDLLANDSPLDCGQMSKPSPSGVGSVTRKRSLLAGLSSWELWIRYPRGLDEYLPLWGFGATELHMLGILRHCCTSWLAFSTSASWTWLPLVTAALCFVTILGNMLQGGCLTFLQ